MTRSGESDAERNWAAVILYYRRGEEIWRTVDSIVRQVPAPRDVVLVDNGSLDGVLNEQVAISHGARLLTLPENRGYAGGMNAGVAAALTTEWILLATHDVVLQADTIRRLEEAALATPSSIAVGPVLEVDNQVWSAGGTIGIRGPRHRTDIPNHTTRAQWLDGCCILVRSSALHQISGIDERYFLYWEDVDLGDRLSRLGGVIVAPSARVSQETARTPIYFGARNSILYWRTRRNYAGALMATLVSVAKLVLRDRRRKDAAAARLQGVRDGWSGRLNVPATLTREL